MPLILTSLLCVQILSAAREPLVAGWDLPSWLVTVDVILIGISAALVVWARSGSIPAGLNYPVVTFAVFLASLAPITFMLATADPGPFYMAMVMLAGSLCFLSIRYLVFSILFVAATYLTAALQVLTLATTISSMAIMMLGATLSVFVLYRRINAAMVVLALEQRVATLESILPMCASCKKTRDHTGKWKSIEEYIEDKQIGTQVSHGSCPSCTEEMYGERLKNRTPAAEAG